MDRCVHTGIGEVAAGLHHTCAIRDGGEGDGHVVCWGSNAVGQLGAAFDRPRVGDDETPAAVSGLELNFGRKVWQLTASFAHTCALFDDGGVRCWGGVDARESRLEDVLGTSQIARTEDGFVKPLESADVALEDAAVQLSASPLVPHTCALLRSGKISCWGGNQTGQLGFSPSSESALLDGTLPTVPLEFSAIEVRAGVGFTCALLEKNLGVTCWGESTGGRLGYGTIGTRAPGAIVPVGETVTGLATGLAQTCALLTNTALRCWGANDYGQLGYGHSVVIGDDETPAQAALPPLVGSKLGGDVPLGGNGVLQVVNVVDDQAMCARFAEDVVCWGRNDQGELGYGHTQNDATRFTPEDLRLRPRPPPFAMLVAGGPAPLGGSALALAEGGRCALRKQDHALLCWGADEQGQLGIPGAFPDGSQTQTPVELGPVHWERPPGDDPMPPVAVSPPPWLPVSDVWRGDEPAPVEGAGASVAGVAFVAAGDHAACAVLGEGDVQCWGRALEGRLGHGNDLTIGDDETPVSVANVTVGERVSQLAVGFSSTCALLDAGGVKCWGSATGGLLGIPYSPSIGDDEPPSGARPVRIGGRAIQIGVGDEHACALLDTGHVRCWGRGTRGRLGYGNTTDIGKEEWPAAAGNIVFGPDPIVQISVGAEHSCAVSGTGDVYCWGDGRQGRLGHANTQNIGDDETPGSVGPIDVGGRAVRVSAGGTHTCALLATGDVRCWGWARDNQLGYGDFVDIGAAETPASRAPVDIGGRVVQIAAGKAHTCALLDTGDVRCWGYGLDGRLGYGNSLGSPSGSVPALSGNIDLGGRAVHIATGTQSCALLETRELFCWGAGDSGQLGYGNLANIGDDESPASAGQVPLR